MHIVYLASQKKKRKMAFKKFSSGSGPVLNTWLTVLFNSPIMLLDNYNHFTGEETEKQYRPAPCDTACKQRSSIRGPPVFVLESSPCFSRPGPFPRLAAESGAKIPELLSHCTQSEATSLRVLRKGLLFSETQAEPQTWEKKSDFNLIKFSGVDALPLPSFPLSLP